MKRGGRKPLSQRMQHASEPKNPIAASEAIVECWHFVSQARKQMHEVHTHIGIDTSYAGRVARLHQLLYDAAIGLEEMREELIKATH